MIVIDRRLAREVRAVFRKLLGSKSRHAQATVSLTASSQSLRLELILPGFAASYVQPGQFAEGQLVAPLKLLDDCAGGRAQPVTLESPAANVVTARWQDGPHPRLMQYEVPLETSESTFPELPLKWTAGSPELLPALAAAMETTDAAPVRYATGCILLRGKTGTIAATDGRQLYKHDGFSFNWEEEALVPRNLVFGCSELSDEEPLRCGMTPYGLFVQAGRWTIALARQTSGQFPRVDDIVPTVGSAATTAQITAADAEFLQHNLSRYRFADEAHAPVTLELNGSVAAWVQGANQPLPVELVLSNSTRTGQQGRFTSSRNFLLRALKLGATNLHIFSPQAAILATRGAKRYIWMPLDPSLDVKPTPNCPRLASAEQSSPVPVRSRISPASVRKVATQPMTDRSTPPTPRRTRQTAASDKRHATSSILDQASQLRTSLRDTLSQTNELIRSLKRQKKQSRLVQSTLASLKLLQTAG